MNATTEQRPQDLETIDLAQVKLDPIWTNALPASGARRFRAIGLCKVNDEVVIATCNRRISLVRDFVASKLRGPFRLAYADEASFRRLLAQVYPHQTSSRNAEGKAEVCVEVCSELLRSAFLRGASDVHLLPGAKSFQTKFRVDGVLEDYREFPLEFHSGLVSRIKVLAGMNIAEKRAPQDGRFSVKDAHQQQPTDIRVATIPTQYGERVTLRLLPPMQGKPALDDLGMEQGELELFARAMSCSNGLVLLSGPTGCGKSTTLYTAISEILISTGRHIITIEDPIEHEIPGASQVEVDSSDKVSFTRSLRSILRHDPDVIMLGEIRDAETAELAIKAALTGHLVFSTLHTNTAAGVVTRLIDMGVEPFLVAATLRLAVAQRLVRRLCQHCKTQIPLSLTDATSLGDTQLAMQDVHESVGCVYCAGKGFNGRAALFEMLPVDNEVSELILQGTAEAKLLEHMQRSGHPLLITSGANKVLAGTTTVQQVLSAVTTW